MRRLFLAFILLALTPLSALADGLGIPDLYDNSGPEYFCWNPSDPREIATNAGVVFTGELKSIEDMGIERRELGTMRKKMVFSVKEAFKGLKAGDDLISVDTESLYNYHLVKGKTYLVYAFRMFDKRISMVGCPRVKPLEESIREYGLLGFPQFAYIDREPGTSITIRF